MDKGINPDLMNHGGAFMFSGVRGSGPATEENQQKLIEMEQRIEEGRVKKEQKQAEKEDENGKD